MLSLASRTSESTGRRRVCWNGNAAFSLHGLYSEDMLPLAQIIFLLVPSSIIQSLWTTFFQPQVEELSIHQRRWYSQRQFALNYINVPYGNAAVLCRWNVRLHCSLDLCQSGNRASSVRKPGEKNSRHKNAWRSNWLKEPVGLKINGRCYEQTFWD
jgi:hypothetical protein